MAGSLQREGEGDSDLGYPDLNDERHVYIRTVQRSASHSALVYLLKEAEPGSDNKLDRGILARPSMLAISKLTKYFLLVTALTAGFFIALITTRSNQSDITLQSVDELIKREIPIGASKKKVDEFLESRKIRYSGYNVGPIRSMVFRRTNGNARGILPRESRKSRTPLFQNMISAS